ncbi:arginase family protein, partial [Clostridioides difficile]
GKVNHIYQLGIRDFHQCSTNSKITFFSTEEIRNNIERIIEIFPKDIKYYVSIDLDVLDPLYLPSTGSIVPQGLTDAELIKVLNIIGSSLDI